MKARTWIREFVHGEEGQDLVEYAVLLALVATGSALYFARPCTPTPSVPAASK